MQKNYNPFKFHNELITNFAAKYTPLLTADEVGRTIITTFQETLETKFPMKPISKRTI